MTNCPNCGAPIVAEKCEYCGSVFLDFAAIEAGAPSYVKFKIDNKYIIAKLILTNLEIQPEVHCVTYENSVGISYCKTRTGYSCQFHMDAEAVILSNDTATIVTLITGG